MILDAISATTTGSAGADRSGIADDFDTFLQILTTQLRNQNPLEPLDTNEFTQQLVQFSQVEQSIKTNENLETMNSLYAASAAANAVGFIGKKISVSTTQAELKNGTATWHHEAAASADAAQFTVRNASGAVIRNIERELVAGDGTFTWDGRDNNGNLQTDGDYFLTIEAVDSDLANIPVDISSETTIDGVDFASSEPILLAGDTKIRLADVKRIFSP